MNRIVSFCILAAALAGATAKSRALPPPDQAGLNFTLKKYDTGTGTESVIAGDFNHDGRPDIATANRWANSVSILYGQPSGLFSNRADIPVGHRPEYLSSADFDANGRDDLVVTNWDDHDMSILLQQSTGAFSLGGRYTTGNHPHDVVATDLNRDGQPDVATATSSNLITVRYNDGLGGFSSRSDLPIDSVGFDLLAADFNRDGATDLLTTLPNTGPNLNLFYGRLTGGFDTRTPLTFPTNYVGYATSDDFNNDGVPDIAYSGYFAYFGPEISLVAPGEDIVTIGPDGEYKSLRGSSFSTCIAASVAALVLSARPDLTADDVETVLKQSAKKLDGERHIEGAGRVDALAAVQLAKSYRPPTK